MALQVKVKDDKIHLELIQCNNFTEVVQILRANFARYEPKSHSWIISPPKYEDLFSSLEDLEPIIVSEETQKKIEALKKPPIVNPYNRLDFTIEDLKVPPWKGKHPYESFQLEDIAKCVNRSYYALFNEQGTGKSYILISALELLRQKRALKKVLFVTSDSGVINIKKEFERFSNFDMSRLTVGGVKNRRPFTKDVDIVLCNYRSFLLISDEYQKDKKKGIKKYRTTPVPLEEWIEGNVSAIVLDESHKIARPTARQTYVLSLVREYFDYAYLATGTPADTEEKYYTQLRFLHPSLVHNFSYQDWLVEYANLGNRFSAFAINYFKKEKKTELTEIVKGISSRRFAEDCIELPEHLEKIIYVELSDLQRKIYNQLIKEKLKLIHTAQRLDLPTIKNLFPYFIAGVDNPCMLIDNPGAPEDVRLQAKKFSFEDHSKLEALDDLLEKHSESTHTIIWTMHPSVGFELKNYLEKKGYECFVVNGQSKPKEFKGSLDDYKDSVLSEFKKKKESKPKILIAGVQVLNSSITIIEANVQIYFDEDFNYTNMDQSKCRVYRIGQSKTVYTYTIIADNTLDGIRHQMLRDKDFINRKFGSKEYLEQEDLQALFNGSSF